MKLYNLPKQQPPRAMPTGAHWNRYLPQGPPGPPKRAVVGGPAKIPNEQVLLYATPTPVAPNTIGPAASAGQIAQARSANLVIAADAVAPVKGGQAVAWIAISYLMAKALLG